MGFTTVPIAARPAKFTWWKRVGAETVRTELKTSEDVRVRAGVRAALEHLGERRGLTKAEQREFANEVDRECGKVFARQAQQRRDCDVVIQEREDRLEVRVKPAGEMPTGENSAHKTSKNGQRPATLVKHFHKNPTHS
jgi:hypothetical protein